MEMYEEMPTDGRKIFYNKAVVKIDDNENKTLYSYGTPIIKKTVAGELTKLWAGWSSTTGRHIKAFCGLKKSEFMELPYIPSTYEKAAAYSGVLYR